MARTARSKSTQPSTTAQRLSSIVKACRDIMRKDKGLNGDLDRLPMLTWIMFLKFLDDMEQIRTEEAKMSGKRFRPAVESPYRWRDWASKPAVLKIPPISDRGNVIEIASYFGGPEKLWDAVTQLQARLYAA